MIELSAKFYRICITFNVALQNLEMVHAPHCHVKTMASVLVRIIPMSVFARRDIQERIVTKVCDGLGGRK